SEHALGEWIDCRRVDAPLAHGRKGRVGGDAGDRQHFLHHRVAGDRVGHGGGRVEDGQLVDAVAAGLLVVVVLGYEQVAGRAGVGRDQRGRNDGRRVVPAEGARDERGGQVAGEMEQPTTVVVVGEGVFEDAKKDIAVGADGG